MQFAIRTWEDALNLWRNTSLFWILSWRRSHRNQSTVFRANKWTDFYIIGASAMKEFIVVWGGITVINDIPLLYLLKTSANQRFTDLFRGYKRKKIGWKCVKWRERRPVNYLKFLKWILLQFLWEENVTRKIEKLGKTAKFNHIISYKVRAAYQGNSVCSLKCTWQIKLKQAEISKNSGLR